MFSSIIQSSLSSNLTLTTLLICIFSALILGFVIALIYRIQGECTQSFFITLVILPAIIQIIIIMVNGNLGAGVAVLGAFSLVRFRSLPGNSKEISFIFFAMAVGLACGMGFILFAAVFTVIISAVYVILLFAKIGRENKKELRITIPEVLDYTGVFDDLFEKYLKKVSLERVKTTNLGSMFELCYHIEFKNVHDEKKFIDELRCRNGNLTIVCGMIPHNSEVL